MTRSDRPTAIARNSTCSQNQAPSFWGKSREHLDELVRMHLPETFRYFRRFAGDDYHILHELLSDWCHNLTVAWSRPELGYQPVGGSYGPLLRMFARNVLRSWLRRRRRDPQRPLRAEHALDSVQSHLPSPEDVAIGVESERGLRTALGRMPRRRAKAIVLKAAGESNDAIARRLGCSAGAAHNLVSRGRQDLRRVGAATFTSLLGKKARPG